MISGPIYSSEMRKRDETIFVRSEKPYFASIKRKEIFSTLLLIEQQFYLNSERYP